jgi:succinylglutamic semialdehyde dehydrogenase
MIAHPNDSLIGSHYIDGQWVNGSGPSLVSINPSDGQPIWRGTHATEDEIINAVHAAQLSFTRWSALDITSRADYLKQFGHLVESRQQELMQLIAKETGKPLWEAATEVNAVIGKVSLSIQSYQERRSEKHLNNIEATSHLRYKPHGVIAVLGPFNFPAHLSNGHIIPALLAGNTVVYKPSELTPAVSEWIMQCWHLSGLPSGVLNCIQGGVESAQFLLQQDIQGVYFTGSYRTGQYINQLFGKRPEMMLALEMGGNNPLMIGTIKDIPAAIYQTLLSTYITAGQRCTCARRLLIADNEAGDDFLHHFIMASKALRVGIYTSKPEPFMGPVISHQHALSYLKAQDALQNAGGIPLLSMSLLADQTGFLSPGIMEMTRVTTLIDEEIFAPLVQIYRYHNVDHALELANQTRYGLVAGLLSDDPEHYQQFYHTVRAGLINWNRPTTGASGHLPFGGIGQSGNHRPSAYFAADYCDYPVASMEQSHLVRPTQSLPGIELYEANK